MFKFLGITFFKKECYKCKETIDKIKCIREHLIVNPYSKEYKPLKIRFINHNIMNAITDLEGMKKDFISKNYNFRKITENSTELHNISKWFTDDEFNILEETDDVWKKYLDLNIWLLEWYNENNNASKGRLYGVSLKIKPYIINIEEVANTLIEYQKQELDM